MDDPDIVSRIARLEKALRAHVVDDHVEADHIHEHDIEEIVGLEEKVGSASPDARAHADALRSQLIEGWGSDEVIGWAPPREKYRA